MFRKDMPRIYELRDLLEEPDSQNSVFRNFDTSIRDSHGKMQAYLALQNDLNGLDDTAWQFLKNEAFPFLTKRDRQGRGWQQLFAILYQARAYNYLKGLDCSNVRFIPRAKRRTPDIQAELFAATILCEVKTINISDEEASARHRLSEGKIITGFTTNRVSPQFLSKLLCSLTEAKEQMESYDGGEHVRRLAYVIVDFDERLGEYKEDYYSQIDRHLAENAIPGLELVFHNQKTPFHKSITMTSATVANE